MREGRGLNHPGYAFLSFYRVLEVALPNGQTARRVDGEAPYPRTIAGLAVLFTGHHLRFQSSQQGALIERQS
jgi:hypothetical protein